MNRTSRFDTLLTDWLEDGPVDAPDRVLDTVLAAFPSIPQRRDASRVPWRLFHMNGFGRALAAVVAIAVVAFSGSILINGQLTKGGGTASLSASTSPSSSPSPSPSAHGFDTSSWKVFSSSRYGVTVRYPPTWTATHATTSWLPGVNLPVPPDPMLDTFVSPDGPMFDVVSQPLANKVTSDAWLAAYEAAGKRRSDTSPECWPAPAAMEKTTVDGLAAWIRSGCGSTEALVFAGRRVYAISAWIDPTLNRPLFDAFLTTVTFQPGQAYDSSATRGTPSHSP